MIMVSVSKKDLLDGLKELGVRTGCKVLVHSSLSSFGYVEGGADTVIDVLIDSVGSEGTVFVPTLTGNSELSGTNPPIFDAVNSPGLTGCIPEVFRKRPYAIRSVHPTHSVAAIGAYSLLLTQDHQLSVTPCDELSPYGKLAHLHDSYVLLIGVSHESSTMFHYIEELVGVDYHMQEGFAEARIVSEDREIVQHVMLHKYGTPRNFSVMEPIFVERGIQGSTRIGNATVRLVKIDGMVQATVQCLKSDRRLLCQR